MLLTDEGQPVLVGNKVESIIPYHTSDEFSIVAKDNGIIHDLKNNVMVIRYDNGNNQCVNLDPTVKKNSSSGFYIETKMITNKKVGDRITKGEVIAWNNKAYTKNRDDLSASMNLGVFAKIAVVPSWDGFEDSAHESERLSNALSTDMIMEKKVVLRKNSFIQYIAKKGDIIKTGDPLLRFEQATNKADVDAFLESMRKTANEGIAEHFANIVRSKYAGEIADVKMYPTVEIEELHPSIQDALNDYWKRINMKNNVYDKYKNKGDNKYYKSGNLLTEYAEKVKPDSKGAVKGEIVDEGIVIIFYIKYKDIIKKGDKVAVYGALKNICAHVVPNELCAYSESNPDEPIDTFIAPLSITNRKVTSVFPVMFLNKLLVEHKKQLADKYLNE